MKISFYKYHGTGNDFIIIDNRENIFAPANEQDTINYLCSRKFGVGADGLMLLNKCKHTDFEMKYFNSDGHESTMCGNGGRCMVGFAQSIGIIENQTTFLAVDGIHEAVIQDGMISLKMQNVNNITDHNSYFTINTGSPHYVAFHDDIDNIDVDKEGRAIRESDTFEKEGINVNFVKIIDNNHLYVRTYERGVEAETLSCGTGAIASAIITAVYTGSGLNHYFISTLGGDLEVKFNLTNNNHYEDIWLTGHAKFIYKGEVDIK